MIEMGRGRGRKDIFIVIETFQPGYGVDRPRFRFLLIRSDFVLMSDPCSEN